MQWLRHEVELETHGICILTTYVSAYSSDHDLWWRIVYQRHILTDIQRIARNLNVGTSTVTKVLSKFDSTGSVDTKPRVGTPKTTTI